MLPILCPSLKNSAYVRSSKVARTTDCRGIFSEQFTLSHGTDNISSVRNFSTKKLVPSFIRYRLRLWLTSALSGVNDITAKHMDTLGFVPLSELLQYEPCNSNRLSTFKLRYLLSRRICQNSKSGQFELTNTSVRVKPTHLSQFVGRHNRNVSDKPPNRIRDGFPYVPAPSHFSTWDVQQVEAWAEVEVGLRKEDATMLRARGIAGRHLLSLTEEKLLAPPFNFLNGAAIDLLNAIKQLNFNSQPPSYIIVPLPDDVTKKLKDPENCLQYKFGTDSSTLIHVGTKRIAKAIDSFVKQLPDSTQRKNAIFVVGPPKSGKTAEAMVIIPQLLEPHIDKVVAKKSQLPCRKVYIDCHQLRSVKTLQEKLWGFYSTAATKLGLPVDATPETVSMLSLKKLFCSVPNYCMITIDEYHMLLSSLPPDQKTYLADGLRDLILDDESPCQFIVTGSTGAALISSMEQSGQNGISLFKGACIVNTDFNSSKKELADVDTLLTHHNRAPAGSPAELIESKVGYVNCAAENIVSVWIKDGKPMPKAIEDFGNRIMDIYVRDYTATLRGDQTVLTRLHTYGHGTSVQPTGAWEHFVSPIEPIGQNPFYVLKEQLLGAYIELHTRISGDGKVGWVDSVEADVPIFDLNLLFPIIRFLENSKKVRVKVPDFRAWYAKWPKGTTADFDKLVDFLAERGADHSVASGKNKTAEQFKDDALWMKQLQDPVELFRIIRNATIPHDDSASANAIQRGADLFISYFKGQYSRCC